VIIDYLSGLPSTRYLPRTCSQLLASATNEVEHSVAYHLPLMLIVVETHIAAYRCAPSSVYLTFCTKQGVGQNAICLFHFGTSLLGIVLLRIAWLKEALLGIARLRIARLRIALLGIA
jgi:hypothetical protein